MSHQLDLAEVTRRLRDQASDLTIQIASLLQGGVLSAAAFSLIAVFQVHDHMAVRIILWLNFVIISLISFLQLCQRSILIVNAGLEVTLMLPVMALFQIIPFAILSSDALGPDGWRYWYVADTLAFCMGLLANGLSGRALKSEQYSQDAAPVFVLAKATFRRSFVESIAATLLTLGLTAWIRAMPPGWPYATAFVSAHLALTIASGGLLVWREGRDAATLRARIAIQGLAVAVTD
jgi:hypothetical protein